MQSLPDLPFLRLERPDPARCKALAALHELSFDQGWNAASMADLFENQKVFGLGCFDENQTCLAFTLFLPVIDECELISIATHPSRRNTGLGRHILNGSLRLVCEGGYSRILLEVAEDNHPARKLYKSVGFSVDGERKNYYIRTNTASVDAVLMSKPI